MCMPMSAVRVYSCLSLSQRRHHFKNCACMFLRDLFHSICKPSRASWTEIPSFIVIFVLGVGVYSDFRQPHTITTHHYHHRSPLSVRRVACSFSFMHVRFFPQNYMWYLFFDPFSPSFFLLYVTRHARVIHFIVPIKAMSESAISNSTRRERQDQGKYERRKKVE